jgi:hypothetical protein
MNIQLKASLPALAQLSVWSLSLAAFRIIRKVKSLMSNVANPNENEYSIVCASASVENSVCYIAKEKEKHLSTFVGATWKPS